MINENNTQPAQNHQATNLTIHRNLGLKYLKDAEWV